jgi:tetratricopeptide (TPR) repeat protein
MSVVIQRIASSAVVCLALAFAAPAALADAAAGRAAFEKGDYTRAMAEWATAAQGGDRDAEFGLGNLNERGDGELRQNYKKAEEWYLKAAEHGHIGAFYRLALMRAAGGDDLPADFVEAYKWILLASEKGIALDVRKQLEQVIDRPQQAEAQKRATSWKEAHAAKPAEPAPTTPTPTTTAPASGGTGAAAIPPPRQSATPSTTATSGGKSGGCPGWPFPTLPCTEQFPALPGASTTRAPTIPPPRSPVN